jgi:O-antigen ligase
VNESSDAINWVRWLFYFLGGVPFVAWLFFTRDRVLRLVAVMAFLLFLQDNIVGRRYVIGGTSIAPSTLLIYVALVAEILAQRRLPQLGAYLPLWLGLLFFAAANIVIGSLGTGFWGVNIKQFQIFYLEGILIFAYAMMALRTDEDFARINRYIPLLGLGVALVHVFAVATGFRFRNAIADSGELYYGGVLDNTNSIGSLFSMWIPVALSLIVGRRQTPLWRFVTIAALAGMFGSLILSGSRGGVLFTLVTCLVAFGLGRAGFQRAAVAGVIGGVGLLVGWVMLQAFAPYALRELVGIAEEEGVQSNRLYLFARYGQMLFDNPFGIGLAPANFKANVAAYGIPGVVSAHNIYLDIALQTGIAGLACFLAIAFGILVTNRRATAAALEPRQRDNLVLLLLPLIGFFGSGIVQPIYSVSPKLNHLFWIACGLSLAASQRVLAARRAARLAEPDAPPLAFAGTTHARSS